MKNIYFTLIMLLVTFSYIKAQTTSNATIENADTVAPVFIIIEQDERVAELVNKKIYIEQTKIQKLASDPNSKVKVDKYGRVNIPGYRLQIMNSTDREAVYNMKGKVYQIYPLQRLYVVAEAPFFKLRFGNFTTKAEAEKYKKALTPMFPSGVFIIPDVIEGVVPKPTTPTTTKPATTKAATKPAPKKATTASTTKTTVKKN